MGHTHRSWQPVPIRLPPGQTPPMAEAAASFQYTCSVSIRAKQSRRDGKSFLDTIPSRLPFARKSLPATSQLASSAVPSASVSLFRERIKGPYAGCDGIAVLRCLSKKPAPSLHALLCAGPSSASSPANIGSNRANSVPFDPGSHISTVLGSCQPVRAWPVRLVT